VRKTDTGLPVLVRVAQVQLGSVVRYGAMTATGGNEVTGTAWCYAQGANANGDSGRENAHGHRACKIVYGVIVDVAWTAPSWWARHAAP
jgi:cobalt-zinc-cadmium resistance protein CzcA